MSLREKGFGGFGDEVLDGARERAERIQSDHRLADAARRFVTAELEMSGDFRPDMGTVTACLAAHHDMYVLAGLPCGCDEGTCPGVLG